MSFIYYTALWSELLTKAGFSLLPMFKMFLLRGENIGCAGLKSIKIFINAVTVAA
jgi:hypothetical protein